MSMHLTIEPLADPLEIEAIMALPRAPLAMPRQVLEAPRERWAFPGAAMLRGTAHMLAPIRVSPVRSGHPGR